MKTYIHLNSRRVQRPTGVRMPGHSGNLTLSGHELLRIEAYGRDNLKGKTEQTTGLKSPFGGFRFARFRLKVLADLVNIIRRVNASMELGGKKTQFATPGGMIPVLR